MKHLFCSHQSALDLLVDFKQPLAVCSLKLKSHIFLKQISKACLPPNLYIKPMVTVLHTNTNQLNAFRYYGDHELCYLQ